MVRRTASPRTHSDSSRDGLANTAPPPPSLSSHCFYKPAHRRQQTSPRRARNSMPLHMAVNSNSVALSGEYIGKGSPYSVDKLRVPELIPVLGSQPADDVSHKPDGRVPLLSARLAVIPATLKRAATSFAAW